LRPGFNMLGGVSLSCTDIFAIFFSIFSDTILCPTWVPLPRFAELCADVELSKESPT